VLGDHQGAPARSQVCPLSCPRLRASFAIHLSHVVALGAVRSLPVGVLPTISKGPNVHQTSYDLLCRMLRRVLLDGVQAGPDAIGGIGSVHFKASTTLYGLLLDHPVDGPGRCRSCRRTGALFGWRRRLVGFIPRRATGCTSPTSRSWCPIWPARWALTLRRHTVLLIRRPPRCWAGPSPTLPIRTVSLFRPRLSRSLPPLGRGRSEPDHGWVGVSPGHDAR
jgi:hypothetical protein